ncbi:hypothetical protein [Litorivivens sp.]|uniref:Nmad3 family putative nucleotide modification protein n=1 Tax=Litorivivens sp. TaxID=2020868 RepID=UPI00356AEF02
MKIILSRKGFDSSAGGYPSPILPDGRLLSLPIPDQQSPVTYDDIDLPTNIVSDLTGNKISGHDGAHLDPDVLPESTKRQVGWRSLFGQFGAAQSHLRNQGVGPGDLFLFFGLFRRSEHKDGRWQWSKTPPKHVLWGWLQIAEVWSAETTRLPDWAQSHPHAGREDLAGNTLYLARRQLKLPGLAHPLPGAGAFPNFKPELQLTAPDARNVSQWRLPRWFYPSQGRPPLSYHQRPERWQQKPRWCELQAAARGQEFVLDSAHYPQANRWVRQLISNHC